MSQVLDFNGAARPPKLRLRVVPRGDDDFLPDALRSPSEEAADPANAPRQVLSEVMALFAGVAVFVFAVTALVPVP